MTHQSKWGYHPCDSQTYRKLKLINKFYNEALHQFANWNRWNRKEPHNRIMRKKLRNELNQIIGYEIQPKPEPELNPVFIRKEQQRIHVWKGEYHKPGKLVDVITFNQMRDFIDDYYRAKYPMGLPELVKPLSNSLEAIDAVYNQLV